MAKTLYSVEDAYALVGDMPEHRKTLIMTRDELYQGMWASMIRDMKRGAKKTPNPSARFVLERDLRIIDDIIAAELK